MSKARDRILETMKETFTDQWVTTSQVAQELGLSREVVSLYLSQLKQNNLVEKKKGRPVLWNVLSSSSDSEFNAFIGSKGSLKEVISKCKAAVNYPSNGLPLIITGPSGTGKSFLAKLIYNYANRQEVIPKKGKFITLNCADYANNLELLSSVLFGYLQGAFTGANKSKLGLLDKADGGFLFLDEVHRLNGESQEKLFTLLDKGIFYPIGSDSNPHKVNVRFIFATTENLDNFLLQTLKRRVPMSISLPALDQRPLWEKYQLIINYFSYEAEQMDSDIYINPATLRTLLDATYPGNIGELENKIKILCAENYNINESEYILIGEIRKKENYLLVGQKDKELIPKLDLLKNVFQDFFDDFESSLSKFNNLESMYKKIEVQLNDTDRNWTEWLKNDVSFTTGCKLTKDLLLQIKSNYGIDIEEEKDFLIKYGGQIFSLINYVNIDEDSILNENLTDFLTHQSPRTAYLIDNSIPDTQLKMSHLKSSIFRNLLIVLIGKSIYKKIESVPFICLLVAHGEGIATNIRNTINSLCNNFIFEAFDMPINSSIEEINKKIQTYLLNFRQTANNGVILFFDMDSLQLMFTKINEQLDSNLLVINNLTTATVLDTSLSVQSHKKFELIAKNAETYGSFQNVQYHEGLSQKNNIVVSCMSGVGISKEIQKILNMNSDGRLDIITTEYADLKRLLKYRDAKFFSNTEFVITTIDFPGKLPIPIINIYGILDGEGTAKFRQLLFQADYTNDEITNIMSNLVKFFSIAGVKHRLHILNPDVVINDVESIVQDYEAYYGVQLTEKIKLNLYMHLALMLERMVLSNSDSSNDEDLSEYSKDQQKFIRISHHIFKPVNIKYNLTVSNDEILLIFEIFNSAV